MVHKIKQKEEMGKFWHPDELFNICNELGLKGKLIPQPEFLPHAWYRFDFLIEKNN